MQTVIGVFENRNAARRALDSLLQAGFDAHRVHRHEGSAPANAATARSPAGTPKAGSDEHRGVLESIGHFFASVFGQDPPQGTPTDTSRWCGAASRWWWSRPGMTRRRTAR